MDQGPIFIIGCPRSGTSLLYYLIAAHPALAYPDIGLRGMLRNKWIRRADRIGLPMLRISALHKYFLPKKGETKYEQALHFLGLDPILPQEGAGFLWYDILLAFGIDPDDFRLSDLRAYPNIMDTIRGRYNNLFKLNKCIILDKSPQYTGWLELIHEIFPNAFVVHAIRDARAVVNSIAYAFKYRRRADGSPWASPERKWWGPKPRNWQALGECGVVERACHQWQDLVERGQSGQDIFGARYVEVRYEQLVAATNATLLELFDHIGLDRFGETLYPDQMENRNYKWKAMEAKTFGDPIWTDRSSISPDEYDYFEITRPLLESLGYVERGAKLFPDPST